MSSPTPVHSHKLEGPSHQLEHVTDALGCFELRHDGLVALVGYQIQGSNEMTIAPVSPTAIDSPWLPSLIRTSASDCTVDPLKMHEHASKSEDQTPITASSSIATILPAYDAADLAHRASMKRQQNVYERRYRAKKRNRLLQARSKWLVLEFELYDLVQETGAVIVIDRKEASTLRHRYYRLLLLRQAILRDSVLMRSVIKWAHVLHLRNLTAETTMETRNEWEAMERQVVGVVRAKPFCLPPFEFSW